MRHIALVAALTLCVASSAYALYSVANEGLWPKTWPQELEPLRKQSRTLVGPQREARHYAIPFTKREDFEAAWPHLLQAKTKGAPILLVRGKNFFLDQRAAGVVVHYAPRRAEREPQYPRSSDRRSDQPAGEVDVFHLHRMVVDGQIVDLNRIELR